MGAGLGDAPAVEDHDANGAVMGRYASYQAAARAAGFAQDPNSWATLLDLLKK